MGELMTRFETIVCKLEFAGVCSVESESLMNFPFIYEDGLGAMIQLTILSLISQFLCWQARDNQVIHFH